LRLLTSTGGIREAGWHEHHHGPRTHLPGQERDREKVVPLMTDKALNGTEMELIADDGRKEFVRGRNLSYELIFLNICLTKFDYACKSLSILQLSNLKYVSDMYCMIHSQSHSSSLARQIYPSRVMTPMAPASETSSLHQRDKKVDVAIAGDDIVSGVQ